jgi:hypothetical protein
MHEVFRILADAFPRASTRSQMTLLDRVGLGPQEEDVSGLDERTREYEIYNLLVWLHQVASNSDGGRPGFLGSGGWVCCHHSSTTTYRETSKVSRSTRHRLPFGGCQGGGE